MYSHTSDDDDDDKSFRSAFSNPDNEHISTQNGVTEEAQDDLAGNSQSAPSQLTKADEERLLQESHDLKALANTKFTQGAYQEAIPLYFRALASCPAKLDYETAVIHSNTAACHIKLDEWDEAVNAATKALDSLERLDPMPKPAPTQNKETQAQASNGHAQIPENTAAEAVKEVDDELETAILRLQESGHSLAEVQKLRVKAMLRRAKARSQLQTWSALQGAEEDYKYLAGRTDLTPIDRRTVQTELSRLAPRLEQAKQREMAEMMDKLKGLGNTILKPFGLSTNNFNFVKDEHTGNYSMNFSQNGR